MIKRILAVLALLAFASLSIGEVKFKALSVTDANQYWILVKPSSSVMLCNTGTSNAAYYRLFDENDTVGAATTSYLLLATSTCITHVKGPTSPANYTTIAIIASTGLTTTVNVYSD